MDKVSIFVFEFNSYKAKKSLTLFKDYDDIVSIYSNEKTTGFFDYKYEEIDITMNHEFAIEVIEGKTYTTIKEELIFIDDNIILNFDKTKNYDENCTAMIVIDPNDNCLGLMIKE